VTLIASRLDVFEARRSVRGAAAEMGFARQACEELVIVVSELASNIVKHGVRGEIRFRPGACPDRGPFLGISAQDVGPPIVDLDLALRDGYEGTGPIDPARLLRRGGIGGGLGAVVRFTDTFEHVPHPGGKTIHVRRYLHGRTRGLTGQG
jgi:anti-sigma regulatory factor (Ser/Thr protein kinase)